jgi:hypothetical protein
MESDTGKAWEDLKSQTDAAVAGLQKAFAEATAPLKK